MKESGRKQGFPSPCAASKASEEECEDCVFAPYFPADEPQKFANVAQGVWCQQCQQNVIGSYFHTISNFVILFSNF
jgi:hypothetical protein